MKQSRLMLMDTQYTVPCHWTFGFILVNMTDTVFHFIVLQLVITFGMCQTPVIYILNSHPEFSSGHHSWSCAQTFGRVRQTGYPEIQAGRDEPVFEGHQEDRSWQEQGWSSRQHWGLGTSRDSCCQGHSCIISKVRLSITVDMSHWFVAPFKKKKGWYLPWSFWKKVTRNHN